MSHHRHAGRAFALGFIVVLVVSAMVPMTALAKKPTEPRLGLHDEQLLAKAEVEGRPRVTILVAARGGVEAQAEAAIVAAGGIVRYRDAELGYLRADVPTGQVKGIASAASIRAVDLDEVVPIPDPQPQGAALAVNRPPPDASTPRANPYLPIQDTGVAAFLEAHPEWDGRGVTIGIVDSGISLDHPSLTTTSTGERKIIDWVTGTDPLTDSDPTWVNMSARVVGATFTFQGVTYTAPAGGSYRIGLFNERDPRLGGEVGNDVNRDGNPAGSSGIFAVLWKTSSNRVWVDANQNRSFADEPAMTNYKKNFDVGYFGTDNPATAIAERMPFVVQTDGKNKFVNIGIVSAFHGSHVAGIAAGHSLFGGEMSGAAPGAKIVSSRACLFISGCTSHALIEGMIYVANQRVDVINMSIGGLPALNDGNNSRCVIYDRLIRQRNVQMFMSIGNSGPGLNTAGDPGLCGTVVGMGAYLTDDTMFADYGVETPYQHNLHYFSSRGPREDGGFKPNAVAPGAAISATPLWQQIAGIQHVPPLPPGYTLANGTSMAAPQAAGLAALLESAAEQSGFAVQPEQIRQALMSSAEFLVEDDPQTGTRFQAYDQGVGLLNIDAAWELLTQRIRTVTITSSVTVNTVLSDLLATPDVGQGIHDREGVTAGTAYTRTYTFNRATGPRNVTYNVSWVGNDGTFSSAASVSLPKGANVSFPVTVNPATAGAHSAILRLDDPATVGIDYQTMNTVIAADQLNAGNGFSVTKSGTIDRAQTLHYFFNVPEGAPAFKVDMTGGGAAVGAGQIRFLRWSPWGLGIDSNAVSNCYNPGACVTGESVTSRTVFDPLAGVWEVSIDARRTSDADNAPFTLTATILGVSVEPDPLVIESTTIGTPNEAEMTATNDWAAFTGGAVDSTLGSALIATPSIADEEVHQNAVTLPSGVNSFRATIGSPSDPAADLDLFVFDCADPTDNPDTLAGCTNRGQSADGDSEESVTVNPTLLRAGVWVVVVDGFNVPAGTTTYEYIDMYTTAPPLGTIDTTDTSELRATGATWSFPAVITALAEPGEGRVLYGNVEIRTDGGVLVGRNDVIIETVSP